LQRRRQRRPQLQQPQRHQLQYLPRLSLLKFLLVLLEPFLEPEVTRQLLEFLVQPVY
jgi:hypothetical protein